MWKPEVYNDVNHFISKITILCLGPLAGITSVISIPTGSASNASQPRLTMEYISSVLFAPEDMEWF